MDELCGRQWLKEDLHTGRADIFISLGLRETETHSLPNLKVYFVLLCEAEYLWKYIRLFETKNPIVSAQSPSRALLLIGKPEG